MESRLRDRLAHLVSSDEAPDSGDESEEDLITSYLGGSGSGSAANNHGSENVVPSIHITPQSPNGNHVLGILHFTDNYLRTTYSNYPVFKNAYKPYECPTLKPILQ
jgi:hypothetical protein